MQFSYFYDSDSKHLAADVQRFVDFLEEHSVESVTNLCIICYPWRNGKRLQAVNTLGNPANYLRVIARGRPAQPARL